jgi:hypothetical protein
VTTGNVGRLSAGTYDITPVRFFVATNIRCGYNPGDGIVAIPLPVRILHTQPADLSRIAAIGPASIPHRTATADTAARVFVVAHNSPSIAPFEKAGFATWGRLSRVADFDGVERARPILGRQKVA